jgi:hypothetical protein
MLTDIIWNVYVIMLVVPFVKSVITLLIYQNKIRQPEEGACLSLFAIQNKKSQQVTGIIIEGQ